MCKNHEGVFITHSDTHVEYYICIYTHTHTLQCLLFAYCQYLVIEFVVHTCLLFGPMYLLLQVSTQTSVTGSSVVGRYGKGAGARAGKGTGTSVGKGRIGNGASKG